MVVRSSVWPPLVMGIIAAATSELAALCVAKESDSELPSAARVESAAEQAMRAESASAAPAATRGVSEGMYNSCKEFVVQLCARCVPLDHAFLTAVTHFVRAIHFRFSLEMCVTFAA